MEVWSVEVVEGDVGARAGVVVNTVHGELRALIFDGTGNR
jgi:hypothetical protein